MENYTELTTAVREYRPRLSSKFPFLIREAVLTLVHSIMDSNFSIDHFNITYNRPLMVEDISGEVVAMIEHALINVTRIARPYRKDNPRTPEQQQQMIRAMMMETAKIQNVNFRNYGE